MADLPSHEQTRPQSVQRVNQLVQFDDAAITDPTELSALYLPQPKNLVVIVDRVVQFEDQAVPAPNSPNNGTDNL
jgi:hypothetical protein